MATERQSALDCVQALHDNVKRTLDVQRLFIAADLQARDLRGAGAGTGLTELQWWRIRSFIAPESANPFCPPPTPCIV